MCQVEDLKVYGFLQKPYLDSDDGKLTGAIYWTFQETLAYCCGFTETLENSNIQVESIHMSQKEILRAIEDVPGAIGMPISIDSRFKFVPDTFIPILETEGQVWVYKPMPVANPSMTILMRIGLPMLLGVLILTGYAAIIWWLLDSCAKVVRCEKHLGLTELFNQYWQSYIAVLTVGFGSTEPRSTLGKLFGMVWILIGLCVTTLLTGIVSGFMGTLFEESTIRRPLYQEVVSAMRGTLDEQVIIRKGAYVTPSDSFDELFDKLKRKEVNGFLIDYFSYWSYVKGFFPDGESFRTGMSIPTSIGVVFNTDNSSLLYCMKKRVFHTQSEIWNRFYWPAPTEMAEANNLITADNGITLLDQAHDKLFGTDIHVIFAWTAGALLLVIFLLVLTTKLLELFTVRRSRQATQIASEQAKVTQDNNCELELLQVLST